jgi:hypothetical protein
VTSPVLAPTTTLTMPSLAAIGGWPPLPPLHDVA